MELYFHYRTTSIHKINDLQYLSDSIIKSVSACLGTNEQMSLVPLACKSIPNGNDVMLIIKTDLKSARPQIFSKISASISDALYIDQNGVRLYNVETRIDSAYTPPTKTETPNTSSNQQSSPNEDSEIDYEKRAKNYIATKPEYTFDRVILPEKVLEKIDEALNIFKYENKVFKEWGLRAIEPHPSSSLSFYGPSGTGKTMAAEAIASRLGKKILRVSYADIESKYHGEGPKMVKAIFYAAERDDAVLFIDEADSLLSKRLTNVSSGSDQAINSMRSQLLISLEKFEGIVIFATNLVVNYDQAFLTRLISVEFVLPDAIAREKIWYVHTHTTEEKKLNIPLATDVDIKFLAEKYEFCGREIKKAVISACIRAAMAENNMVCQNDFISACERIIQEEKSLSNAKDHTVSGTKQFSTEQEKVLKDTIKAKLSEGNSTESISD